jgi:histone H3/H4
MENAAISPMCLSSGRTSALLPPTREHHSDESVSTLRGRVEAGCFRPLKRSHPSRKASKQDRSRKNYTQSVTALARESNLKQLLQRKPLERMARSHLVSGVTHIRQDAFDLMLEGLLQYLHLILTDAYYVTTNSVPVRTRLQARDVKAACKAKGAHILC